MADLAGYRPVWRRPLVAAFHGRRVITNPPPSSGGVLIAYMLSVLDGVDDIGSFGSARALRVLAEAMRAAGRRRDRRFARLLHRGGLAGHLLSADEVEAGRGELRASLAGLPSAAPALASDRGTTHISVVDEAGNAAAFTASNGSHSGVIVPGTGLHLNNMMGEEDLAAGRHLGPGNRLTSMQAPTLIEADGGVRLVVGSSGSNRLRSAITQVVVNIERHGMHVDDAVSAPRVHVEGDRLDCEGLLRRGRARAARALGRTAGALRRAEPLLRRRQRGRAGRRRHAQRGRRPSPLVPRDRALIAAAADARRAEVAM